MKTKSKLLFAGLIFSLLACGSQQLTKENEPLKPTKGSELQAGEVSKIQYDCSLLAKVPSENNKELTKTIASTTPFRIGTNKYVVVLDNENFTLSRDAEAKHKEIWMNLVYLDVDLTLRVQKKAEGFAFQNIDYTYNYLFKGAALDMSGSSGTSGVDTFETPPRDWNSSFDLFYGEGKKLIIDIKCRSAQ